LAYGFEFIESNTIKNDTAVTTLSIKSMNLNCTNG